jgi:hypothetical protein
MARLVERGLGMGIAMVRERWVSTLFVAMACLESIAANALQPSALALESQAQAEFAKVGTAVRERLDRQAAGDLIGAHIAAQDAEAHRYRFLDLKREISRLRSPSGASPSVEAVRNPFSPDAAFLAPSAAPTRAAAVTLDRQEAVVRVEYPVWDMYRPHKVQDRTDTQGAEQHPESRSSSGEVAVQGPKDMYSPGVAKPTPDGGAAGTIDPSASASLGELPRAPYLVYRERLAGSDGGK